MDLKWIEDFEKKIQIELLTVWELFFLVRFAKSNIEFYEMMKEDYPEYFDGTNDMSSSDTEKEVKYLLKRIKKKLKEYKKISESNLYSYVTAKKIIPAYSSQIKEYTSYGDRYESDDYTENLIVRRLTEIGLTAYKVEKEVYFNRKKVEKAMEHLRKLQSGESQSKNSKDHFLDTLFVD